jgi:putative peptidoglycan lipid II flippase|tara:strand:+ start:155 stop:2080 length:1926 start_codon:yes stop_codon:yes gene_type:complete
MSLLKSMATVSGFTALSRVLGFIRDICIGFFLGSGHAADAFFAAFKFPNLFRRIFGEGAFNSAFVPLFGKELNEKGKKEAVQFASQTFSMLAIVLIIITAIAIPLMHWITMIHAPGFKAATTFSVTDNSKPKEIPFGINVRGAKSIYITVDNSGDAELTNATLLYKKKNIPVISSLLTDDKEKPKPLDLIKNISEYRQAEWIKDHQWVKKITLPPNHKYNTLEGKALIHASDTGATNIKIYRNHPETFNLTVTLSKITFIYLLCMALVAHLSGVLNTIKVFGMPAAAPILLNVIFLLGLLGVTSIMGIKSHPLECAHVAAWCVFIAGFVQLGALYITCIRKGIRIRFCKPKINSKMKRLFILMGPGILAAGIQQINLLIGGIIASFREGAISYLYYSERVYQLPLGMIGVGLGIVLLPEVTRRLRKGDQVGAVTSMNRGVEMALLITLPAALAMALIPYPIISTLFQRGAFSPDDAMATSMALAGFSFGVPGYVLVKVLQPGFFARENTKSPMIMAGITVLVNIVVSLLLFGRLGHVGIALATAVAAWVNVALLLFGLKDFWKADSRLKKRLPRIIIATMIMGIGIWIINKGIEGWFVESGFGQRLLGLSILVISGLLIYAIAALKLKATSIEDLKNEYQK